MGRYFGACPDCGRDFEWDPPRNVDHFDAKHTLHIRTACCGAITVGRKAETATEVEL